MYTLLAPYKGLVEYKRVYRDQGMLLNLIAVCKRVLCMRECVNFNIQNPSLIFTLTYMVCKILPENFSNTVIMNQIFYSLRSIQATGCVMLLLEMVQEPSRNFLLSGIVQSNKLWSVRLHQTKCTGARDRDSRLTRTVRRFNLSLLILYYFLC